MSRPRFALLGICAAALGVLAFGTAGAQAEIGAQWLFAERFGSNLVPFLPAFIRLETDVPIFLHTEILKIKVLFTCTTTTAENAELKANGSIGEGAKIKYSGCTTQLNGVTASECEPKAGGEKGVIRTNGLHALMRLHELAGGVRDDLILVLPDSGELITTIELPAECPIGTKVPILGTFTLKDCENLILTHLVKHLLEIGPLDSLWSISKTSEHAVGFLGSWWAKLIGAHEGLKWSGDPA